MGKGKSNYLTHIRFLVLDVDGVLTDGGMYYSEAGDEFKKFNTKDGMAIKALVKSGMQVALLSSGINENIIRRRANLLGIQRWYCGPKEKLSVLSDWITELSVGLENVAYIGDDVNDLEVISNVSFSACPADAVKKVQKEVSVILKNKGGDACVREFIEKFLMDI